jgi:tetratricopeptide (TPR) repeat protein
MKPFRLFAVFLVTLTTAGAALPDANQIARWVRDLGADDFATRQQASAALWKAGAAAEPALEAALKSGDPETVRRAREVLGKFRSGIYPDTPPRVLALIRRYQAVEPSVRSALVPAFCREGVTGLRAIRKLAALETDAEQRTALQDAIVRESGQAAGRLLADGAFAAAEEVLETGLDPAQPGTLRSFAAFHLLRGSLDARARQLRPRAEAGDRKAAAVLAYLYRAKGNLASARWAAERSGNGQLLECVLEEQGDWPALVRHRDPKVPLTDGPPETLALNATYLRLAGRTAESETILGKLAQQAGWTGALPQLLNDRPSEAVAILRRDNLPASAFRFLSLQGRYREAFDLLDKAKPPDGEQGFALSIAVARTWAALGEKDKAQGELAPLAAALWAANSTSQVAPLLKTETALGRRDLAYADAARLLKGPRGERFAGVVFEGLFGDRGTAASAWWDFLRARFPREDVNAILRRLRELFDDHRAGPDFEELAAEQADKLARQAHERDQSAGTDQYEGDLATLADVCRAAGKEALAQTYLEKAAGLAGGADPLHRLADLLADRGRWATAAERYRQAWEKDRSKPVPLCLQGWALTQAGREREGRALMEKARLLALADDDARYELAEALAKHGLTEAAGRELEFLRHTAEFRSVALTNALAGLIPEAVRRGEYARAAGYYQLVALDVLHTGSTFVDEEGYLTVPHAVHLNRARDLLAAGHLGEARPEIEACLSVLPGDPDVVIAAVPVLTRHNRKAEADALYARVAAVHEKACADHPRSAQEHNQLAWLAARCRRDLDRALAHARRAVDLEPGQAGYLDTLAEVYFQRGDRDRAVGLMKKCLKLEPKKEYYRQQLRRFEAGDPAAAVPGER